MKAFVTSIGEATTDLCIWALERNGFDVKLVYNEKSSLAEKLAYIYKLADSDFVRVDADTVVNKTFTPEFVQNEIVDLQWWNQYHTFDWFKQNLQYGGVQYIKKEALPFLRSHVYSMKFEDRPETMLSRIQEFYDPRRFESVPVCVGLHGFATNDIKRIIEQKQKRNYYETYDFVLAEKLNKLLKGQE